MSLALNGFAIQPPSMGRISLPFFLALLKTLAELGALKAPAVGSLFQV